MKRSAVVCLRPDSDCCGVVSGGWDRQLDETIGGCVPPPRGADGTTGQPTASNPFETSRRFHISPPLKPRKRKNQEEEEEGNTPPISFETGQEFVFFVAKHSIKTTCDRFFAQILAVFFVWTGGPGDQPTSCPL